VEPGGTFSRREMMGTTARVAGAAAVTAWVVPQIHSVAYAASTQGSPCPTTNHNCTTSSSQTTISAQGASCTLHTTVVTQGTPTTISGSGFAPSSIVKISLRPSGASLGSFTTAPDGKFSGTVTVPVSTAPGSYTLHFSGQAASGAATTCDLALDIIAVPASSTTAGPTTWPHVPTTGAPAPGSRSEGTDTSLVAVIIASAVALGRLLFGLRSRRTDTAGADPTGEV
jgi:hypothetical protein